MIPQLSKKAVKTKSCNAIPARIILPPPSFARKSRSAKLPVTAATTPGMKARAENHSNGREEKTTIVLMESRSIKTRHARPMPYLDSPKTAGVVPHGNLDYASAGNRRHRGNEAVHFGVERDPLDDGCPIVFQRTSIVPYRYSSHAGNEPVCNLRRNNPGPLVVLSRLTPTDREIRTFFYGLHQLGDVPRIVLQVPIQRDENFATREVDARGHCRRLAAVSPELQEDETLVRHCQPAGDPVRYRPSCRHPQI